MAAATAGAVLVQAVLWAMATPGSLSRTEPPPSPIVGGEPTAPGEFDTVVAVQADNGLCTGIVVAPTLVLTAGHCLVDLELGQILRMYYGDNLDMYQPVDGVSYGVHPEFCRDCVEDIHDYGYVVIASEFAPPSGSFVLPIVEQDEWDEAIIPGGDVTIVGFGEDPAVGGIMEGIGIKRKVTTGIEKFSEQGLEFFAGGGDKDSCFGDSGAPALARLDNGALRIAGITSRGSDPCGGGGYYGAPFPALCWLRDETGVDLLGGACCDCLDMSPPDTDAGCACGPRRDALGMLLPLVVLACVRRRR
jgi:hypothetical protein